MALTVSQAVVHERHGNSQTKVVDVTFDNSYPTGGEAVAAADFGFTEVIDIQSANDHATGKKVAYDRANKKLKVFTAGSTEATNASDQSSLVVRLTVRGY